VHQLLRPEWIPTQDDVLRVRGRTSGIQDVVVKHNDYDLVLVDAGGQSSERRKWARIRLSLSTTTRLYSDRVELI
jgi:guanine nucleotide-binding protein G(i) subunit alpha